MRQTCNNFVVCRTKSARGRRKLCGASSIRELLISATTTAKHATILK